MKIASVLENQKIEKRIAITPEIAKKYISIGLEVSLSENYCEISVINNVFCVENEYQLKDMLEKNTKNNIKSKATNVPFIPVSSTSINARKPFGLFGSGKCSIE